MYGESKQTLNPLANGKANLSRAIAKNDLCGENGRERTRAGWRRRAAAAPAGGSSECWGLSELFLALLVWPLGSKTRGASPARTQNLAFCGT